MARQEPEKALWPEPARRRLGYLYVDTGAIYRTVGYYMRLMGVGPKDKDGIARLIDEVNIDIRYEDGVQHMILNGADVTGEIRTPEMSMYASGVSAQPCVRAFLLDMQRQLCPDAQRRHGWPRYRDGRAAEGDVKNFPDRQRRGAREAPV